LDKIDKVFGFTSGAAGVFIVGMLVTRFISLYQLPQQAKHIP
jgi:hypothetical protein